MTSQPEKQAIAISQAISQNLIYYQISQEVKTVRQLNFVSQ